MQLRIEFERGNRPSGRRPLLTGALIAALLLVGGSLAFGQSAAPATITACYKAKGGAMRILPAKQKCNRGERRMTWRKVGPIGPQGPHGAKGDQGPAGTTGAAGAAGAAGTQGDIGPTGDPGITVFNQLSGLSCTREAQTGSIQILWGAGNVARMRCVLPGDGPVCGGDAVEGGEVCDDGNSNPTDACNNSCVPSSCGDSVVQAGEGCDDGNSNDVDGCTNECQIADGGNNIIDPGEQDELDDRGLARMAREVGMDRDAFRVTGTPAFFINGKPLRGAQPFEAFKTAIDAELKKG